MHRPGETAAKVSTIKLAHSKTRDIALPMLIFIPRYRKQQTRSPAAHHPPQETVQVDQLRAKSSSIPILSPPASREQGAPNFLPQAPQTESLEFPENDETLRSITERRTDVAERTGVEISSTVLGQDNNTGQVPFYTGIIATQRPFALLFEYQ